MRIPFFVLSCLIGRETKIFGNGRDGPLPGYHGNRVRLYVCLTDYKNLYFINIEHSQEVEEGPYYSRISTMVPYES